MPIKPDLLYLRVELVMSYTQSGGFMDSLTQVTSPGKPPFSLQTIHWSSEIVHPLCVGSCLVLFLEG